MELIFQVIIITLDVYLRVRSTKMIEILAQSQEPTNILLGKKNKGLLFLLIMTPTFLKKRDVLALCSWFQFSKG